MNGARPRGPKAAVARYLSSVFETSEDECKLTILDAVAADPPRERLLDLGCFNGAFTADLAKAAQATQVVGVEWLPQHAAEARRRGVDVAETDLNDPLPFPDDAFDLVHANQVIEHVRGTDNFLREVARVCAPGGRVLLATNNMSSWHNVASLALGFQPFPNHVSDEFHVGNPLDPRRGLMHADIGQTHVRVFTIRALKELAAVHGLETTSTYVSGYYPLRRRLARGAARVDPRHAAFMIVALAPAESH
ncbi:class I SAM-dependent methyltransferase [Paraconexibacter sp.]|uniref:class I SAM-dependent methyltransferase n=1 Tax=Paraconexibacter sp. TaxID=2949640 RepID=UPI003569390C